MLPLSVTINLTEYFKINPDFLTYKVQFFWRLFTFIFDSPLLENIKQALTYVRRCVSSMNFTNVDTSWNHIKLWVDKVSSHGKDSCQISNIKSTNPTPEPYRCAGLKLANKYYQTDPTRLAHPGSVGSQFFWRNRFLRGRFTQKAKKKIISHLNFCRYHPFWPSSSLGERGTPILFGGIVFLRIDLPRKQIKLIWKRIFNYCSKICKTTSFEKRQNVV